MQKIFVNFKYLIIFLISFFNSVVLGVELDVVTEDLKPYNYVENGKLKGLSTHIVKQLLDKTGINYKISVYPWARAYHIAQTKQNVLIYTIIKTPRREALFKWVGPLGKGGTTSLYRLKKNKYINATTIEQAREYIIGTANSTMDHIWLKGEGFSKLQTPARIEQAIKMFFKERTDMIAFDDSVIADEFNNLGFDLNDVERVMPLFSAPPYMALSYSTSDDVFEKLQKAYDELLKENKIKLIN
jgi:polar amino acid transport system substrate-binding protein